MLNTKYLPDWYKPFRGAGEMGVWWCCNKWQGRNERWRGRV